MDNLDWKWTEVHASRIPEGRRIVVKMADADDNLTYALGYVLDGKLQITAQEDPMGTLPVYWMALP